MLQVSSRGEVVMFFFTESFMQRLHCDMSRSIVTTA